MGWLRAGKLAVVLAAALPILVATPAEAACGGVKRGNPTNKLGKGRPPLAIWRRTFTDTATGEACDTGSVSWSAAD